MIQEIRSAQNRVSKEGSTRGNGLAGTIHDPDLHGALADGLPPADRAVQHAEVDERHTESEQTTPPAKPRKRIEPEQSEDKAHQAKQQAVKNEGE
jgi:hypothetical protein